MPATHRAWDSSFKGNAAAVLLEIIKTYLDRTREVYSRHTSIVNSSGTGKSRIVDENAYKIITIPMCLRDGNKGFTLHFSLRGILTTCFVRIPSPRCGFA